MTRAAFAVWNDRIAPVFDVARQIHVVEADSGDVVKEISIALQESATQKAFQLAEQGVSTLVCGAISRPTQAVVAAYSIRVIPFVAGNLREVVDAWLTGCLDGERFNMPGYGRGRGRAGSGHRIDQEGFDMNGRGRGGGRGGGGGMGRGMGRGGRGLGRGGRPQGLMGGLRAAGPEGLCVCSQCGHEQPHARGVPCAEAQCPKCGAVMTRR